MKTTRRVLTRYVAERLAAGDAKEPLLKQLAAYLVVNKMTSQMDVVISDISRTLAELGSVTAKVQTARPLSDELRKAVTNYVKRAENANNVTIEESVEPALLGGIVVTTPSKRFDASIASQLKQLRSTD